MANSKKPSKTNKLAVLSVPAKTPPAKTPPAKTPSAKTPSAKTPSAKTPSAKTPPAKTPSAKTPPAKTPPAKTPPAKTPPAKTPPAKTPNDQETPDMSDPIASDRKIKNDMELFHSEMSKIAKLGEDYDYNFSCSNLFEHAKNIIERSHSFRSGVSRADDFLTMTEMEDMLAEYYSREHELSILDFLQDLQNTEGEKKLILKKMNTVK
jgi:hypothetical protein